MKYSKLVESWFKFFVSVEGLYADTLNGHTIVEAYPAMSGQTPMLYFSSRKDAEFYKGYLFSTGVHGVPDVYYYRPDYIAIDMESVLRFNKEYQPDELPILQSHSWYNKLTSRPFLLGRLENA